MSLPLPVNRCSRLSVRSAFSLIEAMVALSITAMAGAVLLLATEGVLKTTNDAVAQTIAQGMAAQLMDEVVGGRFVAVGDNHLSSGFSASSYEKAGTGRERYNDTDDYSNYQKSPPVDVYGRLLGQGDEDGDLRAVNFRSPSSEFNTWRQRIEIYCVDVSNPTIRKSTSQPTDYRAVEVTIERVEPNGGVRPLAKLRRVLCYVPIP
ncbi:MAG TPA: hypothetical protein VL096_03235 [Pirellulaceae bacterium]|nr:hypothetical protein [Pirellulaceae bacterium]